MKLSVIGFYLIYELAPCLSYTSYDFDEPKPGSSGEVAYDDQNYHVRPIRTLDPDRRTILGINTPNIPHFEENFENEQQKKSAFSPAKESFKKQYKTKQQDDDSTTGEGNRPVRKSLSTRAKEYVGKRVAFFKAKRSLESILKKAEASVKSFGKPQRKKTWFWMPFARVNHFDKSVAYTINQVIVLREEKKIVFLTHGDNRLELIYNSDAPFDWEGLETAADLIKGAYFKIKDEVLRLGFKSNLFRTYIVASPEVIFNKSIQQGSNHIIRFWNAAVYMRPNRGITEVAYLIPARTSSEASRPTTPIVVKCKTCQQNEADAAAFHNAIITGTFTNFHLSFQPVKGQPYKPRPGNSDLARNVVDLIRPIMSPLP